MELTHSQAVARLKDLFDELERLRNRDEKEPLNPEDAARFAELNEEFDKVNTHREQLERKAATARMTVVRDRLKNAAEEALARGFTEAGGANGDGVRKGSAWEYDRDPILDSSDTALQRGKFKDPWNLEEVRAFGRDKEDVGIELRSRALSAIEKMSGANDKVRTAATAIIENFDDAESRISKMCLATSSPQYLKAWNKAMRGKPLDAEDSKVLSRAMSLTDSAGGYLTPFQLDPSVILTANGSRNDIRQVARQVVGTTDVWNGVSSGAAVWSWDSEGTQVSDDTTTFAQPAITNYKAAGFIPISIEALQDEQNVTQEVANILAFGKDVLEAAAFATGSGSAQPKGIVAALTGTGSIVNSTTTDTFAIGDVYKLDGALPARYRRNASWLAHRKWYNLVRQFDTAGGAGMWERIGADQPGQLLGRNAYESEDMDGVINASAENYMAVYGDFQYYVIVDRIGFSVSPIPHLFGANGRPTGQSGWYAYYRVGADCVNTGGFTMLDVT